MTPRLPSPPEHPVIPETGIKAVAVVGPSDVGKTGLICRLTAWLKDRGLRVAVLKHSHKDLLHDQGKDTWRFRRAGAVVSALAAPGLLQVSCKPPAEPPLKEVLAALAAHADLILVEGYKSGPLPKVAVLGEAGGTPAPPYPGVIALVARQAQSQGLPVFSPEDLEGLGAFLLRHLGISG